MRNNITSCRDCADRQVGCHASCRRYQEQRAEMDAYKETRLSELINNRRGTPDTAAKEALIRGEKRRKKRRGRRWGSNG